MRSETFLRFAQVFAALRVCRRISAGTPYHRRQEKERNENNMKKLGMYAAILSVTIAAAAMPMTSYAFGFKKTAAQATTAAEEKKYEFKSGETEIVMGAEAAPVIKALGKAVSTFEQDSCAYQGKAKIYTYDGFELGTSSASGKECVESLYITGKSAATPEGIKIGSKKQDVIKAYGKNYKEDFGTLRYTLGNTELAFYTTNGAVDAIEYVLSVTK